MGSNIRWDKPPSEVRIYCACRTKEHRPYWGQAPSLLGLTYALRDGDDWHCLHCRKKVSVVW